MRQRFARERKVIIPLFQGLGYDLTLSFNSMKEKAAQSGFKKRGRNMDNIINVVEEPLIIQKTFEMDEKIEQLGKIRDKMRSCRELYEKKMFENERIHQKIEELNDEALQLMSQVEDDLIRMKTQIPLDETPVQAEGRKNLRINFSLKLHEVAQEIRNINMEFLLKSNKYNPLTQNEWFSKHVFDSEMGDLLADQILDEEKEIESIAQRRQDDITNIALSVEKIASQFKQLHNLVIEQGTVLDRIDYNIEKSVENTSKGKKELVSANQWRSKTSKLARKVITVQITLIFIFCFLLYFKYRNKSSKGIIERIST